MENRNNQNVAAVLGNWIIWEHEGKAQASKFSGLSFTVTPWYSNEDEIENRKSTPKKVKTALKSALKGEFANDERTQAEREYWKPKREATKRK